MRWLKAICQGGQRRRQDIMRLFALHPDHEYTTREVYITLGSWVGVIHPDLTALHRKGLLHCRIDENGTLLYWFNGGDDDPGSACMPDGERWRPPPPRRGGSR